MTENDLVFIELAFWAIFGPPAIIFSFSLGSLITKKLFRIKKK